MISVRELNQRTTIAIQHLATHELLCTFRHAEKEVERVLKIARQRSNTFKIEKSPLFLPLEPKQCDGCGEQREGAEYDPIAFSICTKCVSKKNIIE